MTPPHRWLLPPAIVAAFAIVGSLALHVPAYVGLGILNEVLRDDPPAPAAATTMEVEIVERRPSPTPTEVTDPEPVEPEPVDDEPVEDEAERAAQADVEPEPRRPEAPPDVPEPVVVEATPPPPQPSRPPNRTSVAHRSRDPNVEPPDDADYLAEENSRVEEETMARVTNNQIDDPEPQAAAAEEPPSEREEEGDAAEDEVAELQDAEGSDERDPTPEEARLPPERPREASRSPRPQPSEAAQGDRRAGGAGGRTPPGESAGGGRRAQGGGATRTREVIVSDGTGTFRMRVPVDERPEGESAGEGGGVAIDGRGRGSEGRGRASGRAGRGERRARGGGRRGGGAPDLRLSWSDFASVYGEEELRREREAWLEQRRSRTAGAGHQRRWQEFRAALENYDVRVRPGNQTALNTRADPFAAFIAAMHRRIHPRFAGDFVRHLPPTTHAMLSANPNMHTLLEIAVGPTGNVERIGVVATSGDILFDYGAYNAVMGAQPFSAPPESIRSPDGLVYLRWGFYANHRQCGTFNAEAYILAAAPERDESEAPLVPGEPIFQPSEARE